MLNYLKPLADAIRQLTADAVEKAGSGHPGMPMGMADVATVLMTKHMRFSPHNPQWINRDRLIISNGHGSMLLYSLLYLLGYEEMTLDQIKSLRTLHSLTPAHPEHHPSLSIETTTGPLGQGLGNAVGIALAETHMRARFGDDLINHHTYVMAGDGCLMEGISHEVLSLAGHLQLNKLIVLFDSNQVTIDGDVHLASSENVCIRMKSYGWHTISIDGHDFEAIDKALTDAKVSDKPTFIECKTRIGRGSPTKEGSPATHGSVLGAEEVEALRKALNVSNEPFIIHPEILKSWQNYGRERSTYCDEWNAHYEKIPKSRTIALTQFLNKDACRLNLQALKENIAQGQLAKATRQWSQEVLNVVSPLMPNLIGGSADLTTSNNTKAKDMSVYHHTNPQGNYIHYGIREHGMAAIMNGLSLHSGIIPYGGTFLTFSDYLRPALRLSALMKRQVIYVMTHDSIGLGEDGPTHQPIEHLNSLRLIPNLLVLRPADGVETAECWEIALQHKTGPSVLCLSRQSVPCVRTESTGNNLSLRGGYTLKDTLKPVYTIIATGSEVQLALHIAEQLPNCRVVSMPSQELFLQQPQTYQDALLSSHLITIEAGTTGLWHRLGRNGLCIGIDEFGHSGAYQDVYNVFGLTAEAIIEKIRKHFGEIT